MKNNVFKIKFFLVVLLFIVFTVFLFSNSSISKAAYSFGSGEATWTFSSASDFNGTDVSKLQFSDGSAKIIPTGFETAWGKIWHDTHFAPNPGDSGHNVVVADSSGYLFFGGYTNNGAGGQNYGFIVKADQNLNEVWYKNDYFPGALQSEIYRMKFISDGNILVHSGYQDSSNNCHSVLMKINPNDGSVIWSTTIDQPIGVVKLSGWDRAAGPVVDSNGNIYMAVANHTGTGQNDADPTGIYKFDSNGNLIWSRSDALSSYLPPLYWEDLWDMVVDSEGSVYLSIGADETGVGLRWGLLKYDTNGNRVWTNIKHWAIDKFEQPRGIAIDSADYIYQNGNAGNNYRIGAGCGIRKLDKNENVLYEEILIDIAAGDGTYCWGSVVDQFDNWAMSGQYWSPAIPGAYIRKHKGSDLSKINVIEYLASSRLGSTQKATHASVDPFGNIYSASYFKDNNYSNQYSVVILKGVNTYPNTTPGTGTALTLINKTPVDYNTLSGFSANYGPMDQADVKFQISNNGTKWYFWNGSSWIETAGYNSNTETEVNQNISKFSDQFGPGQFYFKSFMITDGTKQVDLASITITKDQSLNVLPATGKTKI